MRIPSSTTYKLGWMLAALGLLLPVASSCEEDLGAEHCEEPGSDEKCQCSDGRGSYRTCDAFNTWGACYCNTTGCGNNIVEMGEQCDDGNLDNNDGCDENCLFESSNGGAGPGPGPGGFGGFGGTGGVLNGGMGGMGGALGGMGGIGGAPGGMGGIGGN